MLRFLSRRKRSTNSGTNQSGDSHQNNTASQIKSQRILPNKNQIECRVILLDGTDLSVYLTVSTKFLYVRVFEKKIKRKFVVLCFSFVLQKFDLFSFTS